MRRFVLLVLTFIGSSWQSQACVTTACASTPPVSFVDLNAAERQLLARGATSLTLDVQTGRCYVINQKVALSTAGAGADRVRWGWATVGAVEGSRVTLQVTERLLTDQILAPDCADACHRVLVHGSFPADAQVLDIRLANQRPQMVWPSATREPIAPNADMSKLTAERLRLDPNLPIVVLAMDTQIENRHVMSVMRALKTSGSKSVVWGYGGVAGLYGVLRPFGPPTGVEVVGSQEAWLRLGRDWQPIHVGSSDSLRKMRTSYRQPTIEITAGVGLNPDPSAQLSRHLAGLERLPQNKSKPILVLGYDANQRWTGNLIQVLRSRGYHRLATVAGGWLELSEGR
jgi:hypothetical protein